MHPSVTIDHLSHFHRGRSSMLVAWETPAASWTGPPIRKGKKGAGLQGWRVGGRVGGWEGGKVGRAWGSLPQEARRLLQR